MDLVADNNGNIVGSMEPENEMLALSERIANSTQKGLTVSAKTLIIMQKEN